MEEMNLNQESNSKFDTVKGIRIICEEKEEDRGAYSGEHKITKFLEAENLK